MKRHNLVVTEDDLHKLFIKAMHLHSFFLLTSFVLTLNFVQMQILKMT